MKIEKLLENNELNRFMREASDFNEELKTLASIVKKTEDLSNIIVMHFSLYTDDEFTDEQTFTWPSRDEMKRTYDLGERARNRDKTFGDKEYKVSKGIFGDTISFDCDDYILKYTALSSALGGVSYYTKVMK